MLLYYDCAFTGCSSVSLMVASFVDRGLVDDRTGYFKAIMWAIFISILGLAYLEIPIVGGFLYVGLTALGVAVNAYNLILFPFIKRALPPATLTSHGRGWLLTALVMTLGAYGTVVVDPVLCRWLSPHGTWVTWIFWCSDFGFLCMFQYIHQTRDQRISFKCAAKTE